MPRSAEHAAAFSSIINCGIVGYSIISASYSVRLNGYMR